LHFTAIVQNTTFKIVSHVLHANSWQVSTVLFQRGVVASQRHITKS
jgi:hypothetical protein